MQLLNKLRATQIRKVEDDSDIFVDCRCERHCDSLCICHRQDATNEDDSDDVTVKIEPEERGVGAAVRRASDLGRVRAGSVG